MKFEELRAEMIKAMKARDKKRKEVISSLISASKKIAIDEGTRDEISDEQVYELLEKGEKYANEVANAKLLEAQKAFHLR